MSLTTALANRVSQALDASVPVRARASQPASGTSSAAVVPAFAAPPPVLTLSPEEARAVSTGAVPPVVLKAGLRAFEVVYPAGQRGGGSTNANFTIAPPQFFPATEARVSFKLFLDESFPLTPTPTMPRIGGKIGGLRMGRGDASGGKFSSTAASCRLTWANEGGVLAYLYPQLRGSYVDNNTSNIPWSLVDQSPGFQRISRIHKGIHVFMPAGGKRGDFRLTLHKGRWNDIELYCKLNTVGMYDGVIEVVVNGVRERTEEVRFRHTDLMIDGWLFHTFFGGSQRPPRDTRAWFADFSFSNK